MMKTINKPDEKLFKDLYEIEVEFLKHETPERPTDINYRLRNKYYTVDYDVDTISEEFLKIYKAILNTCVSDEVRQVMSLYFDNNGKQLLTDEEISEITGFNILKVKALKNAAFGIIKRDEKAKEYYQKKMGKRKTTLM